MRAIDTVHLPVRVPGRPTGTRWWLLLALSLLLHLLLLAAAGGGIGMPAAVSRAPAVTVVSAGIVSTPVRPAAVPLPIEPTSRVQATAAPTPPRAVTPPRRRQAPPSQPPPVATAPSPMPAASVSQNDASTSGDALSAPTDEISGNAAQQLPSATAQAGTSADASATAEPIVEAPASRADAAPGPVAKSIDAATAASAASRYKVSLPPSVTLSYEVRYATRGSITRGSSTVDWRSDGGTYAIRGEVSKFGFTLSAFRSEGAVDDAGIAPVLYAEKNARRAETNTHFLRDARQAISFSATADSFPLQPGAQDRASILWQLAGIARGQRALFVPGTMLDVVVAGVRDAEHWMIEIVGEETVNLDTGPAQAWHLVRAPRTGTYDKRIDIWLAPAQQWYPVKLRYTEQSGDTLDLSLSALR